MLYYFYKITVANQIYIGSTTDPKDRWRIHISSSKETSSQAHLKRYVAMRKIGIDNCIFEILYEIECTDFNEARKYEQIEINRNSKELLLNDLPAYCSPEDRKESQKEIKKTDKWKEYHKEYSKEYHKTDKWKEYQKDYNSRPDVRERQKERQKEYQKTDKWKEYKKEYNSRPENKERARERYAKKKLKSQTQLIPNEANELAVSTVPFAPTGNLTN